MKIFLVISCVFAFAAASVDQADYYTSVGDDDGYAYSQAGAAAGAGASAGASAGGRSTYSGADSYAVSSGSASLQTGSSGFLDYSSGGRDASGATIIKPVIKHGPAIVSKAFYLHEIEAEAEAGVNVQTKEHLVHPRKHYNIVFVKTPVAGGSSVSSSNVNVFPENEEKTIIYVLNGRNDGVTVNEDGSVQIPEPKAPSKPEVVFVKYNNEADAQRAISDIQSQYNSQSGATVNVIGAGNTAGFRSTAGATAHSHASAHSSVSADTESKPIRSVRYRKSVNIPAAAATHFQVQKSRELAAKKAH